MNWEKLTVYVQRDERTGVITRIQEDKPTEYLMEQLKKLRDLPRELRDKRKRQD